MPRLILCALPALSFPCLSCPFLALAWLQVPEFAPVETKPIGWFEDRAKGLTAGTGPAPVPKYQPSMVPEGHFHAMANPVKEVDNGTVPEGMLPQGLTLKNYTQQQVQ